MDLSPKQLRKLGTTDILISPIGLGTWQFSGGKGLGGGYWNVLPDDTILDIIRTALQGGVNWFDTAEFYGHGESERNLSSALQQCGVNNGEVVIGTKWWPVLKTAANIKATIDDRVNCLSPYAIDLHMVHQPFSLSSIDKQMHAMADLVEDGKIRAVGVSNFSAKAMVKAHDVLHSRGIPLASNQMRYSPVYRNIESNGVLDAARERGITLIAWSPLEQGLVSGKFHKNPELTQKLGLFRKFMFSYSRKRLEQTRPLVEAFERIGNQHNCTPSQVALNWLINFHGDTVVAIPGASNASQMQHNTGAMDFTLSGEEMDEIDSLSRRFC